MSETQSSVRIGLLGGFGCSHCDGGELALQSRKVRGVLAYLALARGKRAVRDELAATFWPSAGEQQARQSLRQCLTVLRKALNVGGREILSADGAEVVLDAGAVTVDVDEVLRGLESDDEAVVLAATPHVGGALLENHVFGETEADDWLRDARVRLHSACQRLLFRCVELYERRGAGDDVQRTYWQILRLHPACEEAHRGLMRAYAAAGNRSEALSQFRACQDALARHVDAVPSAQTVALFEELRLAEGGAVPARSDAPTLPLPDKPAIAVLAFDNLSGDPSREYVCDGFSEDITTALSQFAALCVIARNSAFAFKGRGVTVPEIGRQLGVHYVLQGSVRSAGERFRVNAQLIDADTNAHVWSQQYDGVAKDVFAFQDDIVQQIVATTAGRIEAAALARARRKRPDDLVAYDYVLRGMYHHHRNTPQDVELALDMFRKALELAPDYPLAYGWLACSSGRAAGFTMDRAQKVSSPEYRALLREALGELERRVEIDAEESECLRLMGEVYLFEGDHERASHYVRKAYAFNPNDDRILAQMSALLAFSGDAEQAVEFARRSMRCNPYHPGFYKFNLGRALVLLERYDEAIEPLATAAPPQNRYRAYLAACYAALERGDDAAAVVADVLAADPTFSLRYFSATFLYRDPAVSERLLALMKAAGLPE